MCDLLTSCIARVVANGNKQDNNMRQGTVYPKTKHIMTQNFNSKVLLQTPATFLPRHYK